MTNHSSSNKEKKNSQKEPQIWDVSEPDPKPAECTPQNPPQKWYTKSILPQVRWKEVGEVIGFMIALAVGVVYWKQLEVMIGQLNEMQGGSSQTSQLIVNAAHQSGDTQKLAIAAGKQADQAIIQAQALVGANRAWMVPTSFSQQVSPIVVTFNNAGKTPAVNLVGKAEYATKLVFEKTDYNPNPDSSLSDGCEHLESIQWTFMQPVAAEGGNADFTLGNLPQKWNKPITAIYGYKTLTIHGCLWYQDTLTNQKRWTEFWLQAANFRWRNEPYNENAATTNVYIHNGNIFVFH